MVSLSSVVGLYHRTAEMAQSWDEGVGAEDAGTGWATFTWPMLTISSLFCFVLFSCETSGSKAPRGFLFPGLCFMLGKLEINRANLSAVLLQHFVLWWASGGWNEIEPHPRLGRVGPRQKEGGFAEGEAKENKKEVSAEISQNGLFVYYLPSEHQPNTWNIATNRQKSLPKWMLNSSEDM